MHEVKESDIRSRLLYLTDHYNPEKSKSDLKDNTDLDLNRFQYKGLESKSPED